MTIEKVDKMIDRSCESLGEGSKTSKFFRAKQRDRYRQAMNNPKDAVDIFIRKVILNDFKIYKEEK